MHCQSPAPDKPSAASHSRGLDLSFLGSSSCPAGHVQPLLLPWGLVMLHGAQTALQAQHEFVMPWNGCREISGKMLLFSVFVFEMPWQGIPLSFTSTSKSRMGSQSFGDRSRGCRAPGCSFLCYVSVLHFRISSSSFTHFLSSEWSPRCSVPFYITPPAPELPLRDAPRPGSRPSANWHIEHGQPHRGCHTVCAGEPHLGISHR